VSAGAVAPDSTFAARLVAGLARFGPVCAGIDPHPPLLRDWQLPVSAAGAREFGYRVVEAAATVVAVVKPQVAFYERYGSAGFAALEDVLDRCREAGLLVIADAKRGDIGTSAAGYAEAWLGEDSPLAADAVTVSPYLGYGSLQPFVEQARRRGRGVFVLAVTSNPEGAPLQLAQPAGDRSVAAAIASAAAADNVEYLTGPGCGTAATLGPVGLVVGVTSANTLAAAGIDLVAVGGPILAPGLGTQGGTAADVGRIFGAVAARVTVAVGRDVLRHGPDVGRLREQLRRHNADTQAALRA